MNTKTKFLAIGIGALTALNFSSCSDYTEFTEGEIRQDIYNHKYAEAFIQQFGQPDPNHDWGMNEKLEPIFVSQGGTRAAGFVEVNRNEWTMFDGKTPTTFPTYNGNGATVDVPNFTHAGLGRDIKIPGWPHLNGLYYAANGNVLLGAYTGEEVGTNVTRNGQTNMINIPAGDVTPYEIQYVSNWFRTHKITNPEDYRLSLHLSDFFIQNVSCDFDQVEYKEPGTYSNYQNNDDWPMTGNNGANISDKSQTTLLKNKDGGPYAENLSENISYDLDNLGFMSIDEEWTHVNNFNRGNSNFDPEDNESNPNREIKYVKSAGTEDFRCHPSWCTETEWIKSWVLVRLTWEETVKDPNSPYDEGTVIPREGYYLAFDFHGEKQGQGGNQIVHQDGYYSNWIIKITPGYFTPTGQSRRIFCEDLGGSFDFDFNDAVIDVAFEQLGWPNADKYQPIISVQAAGGTMPIYVEKKENKEKYELHRMLGQKEGETLTPINVQNSRTHIPAVYRGEPVKSNTPGAIKIYVDNSRNNVSYQISGMKTLTGEEAKGEDERSQLDVPKKDGSNLNKDTYKDETDVAPRAFAVPTSVKWMNELTNIEVSYKDFPQWVADAKWMNTTLSPSQHWYEYPVDAENSLFTSVFTPEDENPTGGGGYDAAIRWTPLTPDPSAQTAAGSVSANSWLLINKYTSVDAVKTKLNEMPSNDGRVTFVVVLSSPTLYNQVDPITGKVSDANQLKGIITPADIANSQLSYNGGTFNYATMSPVNSATLVEGNHEFGANVYTYTLQFSLSKSEILNSAHTSTPDDPYHDYILFYLQVGKNGTIGDASDVTVQKWYVHY